MNKFADSCLQKLANHKAVLTIPEVDRPLLTHCKAIVAGTEAINFMISSFCHNGHLLKNCYNHIHCTHVTLIYTLTSIILLQWRKVIAEFL